MCACGPPLVSSRPPWLSFFYYFLCVSVRPRLLASSSSRSSAWFRHAAKRRKLIIHHEQPTKLAGTGIGSRSRRDARIRRVTDDRVAARSERGKATVLLLSARCVAEAGRATSDLCRCIKISIKQRSRQFDCNQRPMSRSNRLENHVNSTFP